MSLRARGAPRYTRALELTLTISHNALRAVTRARARARPPLDLHIIFQHVQSRAGV